MENSFFEYRDKTGAESDSDGEIIDNSLTEDFYTPIKKPAVKNQTVFVAESEESSTDGKDPIFQFEYSKETFVCLKLGYYSCLKKSVILIKKKLLT